MGAVPRHGGALVLVFVIIVCFGNWLSVGAGDVPRRGGALALIFDIFVYFVGV